MFSHDFCRKYTPNHISHLCYLRILISFPCFLLAHSLKASKNNAISQAASSYLSSAIPKVNKKVEECIPGSLASKLKVAKENSEEYKQTKNSIEKWLNLVNYTYHQISIIEKELQNPNLLQEIQQVLFKIWLSYIRPKTVTSDSIEQETQDRKEKISEQKLRLKKIESSLQTIDLAKEKKFLNYSLQLLTKSGDYTAQILQGITVRQGLVYSEEKINQKINYIEIIFNRAENNIPHSHLKQQLKSIINNIKNKLLNNINQENLVELFESQLEAIDYLVKQVAVATNNIYLAIEKDQQAFQQILNDIKTTIENPDNSLQQTVEDSLFVYYKDYRQNQLESISESAKQMIDQTLIQQITAENNQPEKLIKLKKELNNQFSLIEEVNQKYSIINNKYYSYSAIVDYLQQITKNGIKQKEMKKIKNTLNKINELVEAEQVVKNNQPYTDIFSREAKQSLQHIILDDNMSAEEAKTKIKQIKKSASLMNQIREKSEDVYNQLNGKNRLGPTFPMLLTLIAPNSLIETTTNPLLAFPTTKEEQNIIIDSVIELMGYLVNKMKSNQKKDAEVWKSAAKKIYSIISFGIGTSENKDYTKKVQQIKQAIDDLLSPSTQIPKNQEDQKDSLITPKDTTQLASTMQEKLREALKGANKNTIDMNNEKETNTISTQKKKQAQHVLNKKRKDISQKNQLLYSQLEKSGVIPAISSQLEKATSDESWREAERVMAWKIAAIDRLEQESSSPDRQLSQKAMGMLIQALHKQNNPSQYNQLLNKTILSSILTQAMESSSNIPLDQKSELKKKFEKAMQTIQDSDQVEELATQIRITFFYHDQLAMNNYGELPDRLLATLEQVIKKVKNAQEAIEAKQVISDYLSLYKKLVLMQERHQKLPGSQEIYEATLRQIAETPQSVTATMIENSYQKIFLDHNSKKKKRRLLITLCTILMIIGYITYWTNQHPERIAQIKRRVKKYVEKVKTSALPMI
ncbi:MAG: hypothetical protein AAF770_01800 [Bacteroidota bacterium]